MEYQTYHFRMLTWIAVGGVAPYLMFGSSQHYIPYGLGLLLFVVCIKDTFSWLIATAFLGSFYGWMICDAAGASTLLKIGAALTFAPLFSWIGHYVDGHFLDGENWLRKRRKR